MLSQVAEMLEAPMHGVDVAIANVSTDTRQLPTDALFFALQGPNFDAHEVLDRQSDLPLAALVVSRPVAHSATYILVEDTRAALGKLAAAWRSHCDATVIGLTGSNGKTTVKEMLAKICSMQGKTLATQGNLNNDIGVPLTLLRLRPEHDFAVVEMGANHPGEIHYLSTLVQPDVALLINATAAHLEGFGSLEAVADAKGEIFTSLADRAVAVINADSRFSAKWGLLNQQCRVVSFGRNSEADCRVANDDEPLVLVLDGSELRINLQLLGEHNKLNAAAAAAAAYAAGLDPGVLRQGLEAMKPVSGRLCPMPAQRGALLIDDSYNANPASLQAAIQVLAAQPGKRYLVLGDMAELGDDAIALHVEAGQYAREAGLDGVLTLGPLSCETANSFGNGGECFSAMDDMLLRIQQVLAPDVTLLVKGSRSAHMERVVTALQAENGAAEEETHHAA